MAPDRLAARYRRFAEEEAHGRSPLYQALALGVAGDPMLLARIAALPPAKQQPNLLLAAMRHVCGLATDWPGFRAAALARWEAVRAVMLARSTQTNEPGRCATLLPALARLPQPLALIEVGASAGLCLLPDRYGYDYGHHRLGPADGPVFPCQASANTPLPAALPRIAWRAGLDLNPLDVADPEQMAWLETLVWPGQDGRAERLRQAIHIARVDPPPIHRGDLRTGLAALAAEAPRDATLVIFHSAVLAYLPDAADRSAFAAQVQALCPCWLANEAPHVLPGQPGAPPGRFVLAQNGVPVAWTDPHGSGIEWLAG